jgi:hypothetical protein
MRQRGVSGMLVIVVMLLLMIGLLAGYTFTRFGTKMDEQATTIARLRRAAEALEAYGAAALRLPCPADGTLDTGDEVRPTPTSATCTQTEGTLPWKTIGLRRTDAYDEWGNKISYRVYINAGDGSLTQNGGIDMSQCDLLEPSSVIGAGRLCRSSTDPYQRNTSSAHFLTNKGLTLTDMGVAASNRAYVLLSHGESGFGAYTSSGVKREDPTGDERDNMRATGPFTIRAFSDTDTAASSPQHFDDLLFYRTVEEVVKRANLAARDWPEGAIFNAATLAAIGALGGSFAFMGNTFRAVGGSNAFNSQTSGGTTGIGVSGDPGLLNTTATFVNEGEIIRIELGQDASRMGFTLNHFGKLLSNTSFREQVLVRFYNSSNVVVGSTLVRQGCRDDGGLASFVVEPSALGSSFRNVELEGEVVTNIGFASSSFLLSEVAVCTTATCDTTLSASSNACLRPSINVAFAPSPITRPASSVLSFTITNGTDNPAYNGLAFSDTLPAGLVMANSSVSNTCGGTVTTPAAGATGAVVLSGGSLANNAASCVVSVNVTASAAGSYRHPPSQFTATANLINSVSTASPPTLVVQ